MKYHEFITLLESDDANAICKLLKQCPRNKLLAQFQDYYDGFQWLVEGMGETRTTRSGKEMWKPFDDNPSKGFTSGELKIWNWIKMAISTYAKYTRGDDKDDVQIVVNRGTDNDDVLSEEANKLFEDLNEFVIKSVVQMSVFSVLTTKYTILEAKTGEDNEGEIIKQITLNQEDNHALVELINPMEIEPLYWNDRIRGMIRFYMIDKEQASTLGYKTTTKKEYLFWEVWFYDKDGKLILRKYIEENELPDASPEPYNYLPYMLVPNQKHNFNNFDLNNIEVSDVNDMIDLQDDINAFLTDLNILYRRVAIPMLRATDEFMKNATDQDITKVKKAFQKINTAIGTILFAPLQASDAPATSSGQDIHLSQMFDQFYRETGIPKSIINSEGLGNIASETLDHLFQSLKVIIGEKRTQINKMITNILKMHFLTTGQWTPDLSISIEYPGIFAMTGKERTEIVLSGLKEGILPKTFAIKEVVKLLGEGENVEEIQGQLADEDSEFKMELEATMAKSQMEASNEQSAMINNLVNQNRNIQEINAGTSEES